MVNLSDIVYEDYLSGVAVVTFKKKTAANEVRVMRCTANLRLIPPAHHPKWVVYYPENVVKAFDLDKGEWRSFIKENVMNIERVEVENNQDGNN